MYIVKSRKAGIHVWLSHKFTQCVVFRHVCLCVILAFWNPSILFLFPFLCGCDGLLLDYLLQVFVYKKYLKDLINDAKDSRFYMSGEHPLIDNIISENSKYEINQQIRKYSNFLNRESGTIILKNNNWRKLSTTSYNSCCDYNIIVIPSHYDLNKPYFATMIAHEYCHGMGHDCGKAEKYSVLLVGIGTIILVSMQIMVNSPYWWLSIICLCSIVYLYIHYFSKQEFNRELDADIGAIRFFENMSISYHIKTSNNRTVVSEIAHFIAKARLDDSKKTNNQKRKYIKKIWPFLSDDDRKIIANNNSFLNIDNKRHYDTTEEIYMVMYDTPSIFTLAVMFSLCIFCGINMVPYLSIKWYYLFLAILPFFGYIILFIKSKQLWKQKTAFLEKIGKQ